MQWLEVLASLERLFPDNAKLRGDLQGGLFKLRREGLDPGDLFSSNDEQSRSALLSLVPHAGMHFCRSHINQQVHVLASRL